MDEESVRDKLRQISDVMDNFSLETMKIAKVQADLCDVKKENTMLSGRVSFLEQENAMLKAENTMIKGELGTLKAESTMLKAENTIIKGELGTLKDENKMLQEKVSFLEQENTILKKLNKTMLEKFSTLEKENSNWKSVVDKLQNDVQMLMSKQVGHQSSNEQAPDIAGGTNEPEPVGAKEETNPTVGKTLNSGRKPKTQRKREQNEIFRNWRKTMKQRKTSEDLWASGLLIVTIQLWEDEGIYMDGDQILDFIRRNIDQFTTFILLSEESKERFFLTVIKMCSMRKISKEKFQEIMLCFVNQGPRRNRITELEVQKFIEMYKE